MGLRETPGKNKFGLTTKAAARLLRVHQNTIQMWLRSGVLKGGKIEGRWYVDEKSINKQALKLVIKRPRDGGVVNKLNATSEHRLCEQGNTLACSLCGFSIPASLLSADMKALISLLILNKCCSQPVIVKSVTAYGRAAKRQTVKELDERVKVLEKHLQDLKSQQ
jgi:excisionase family DNA binding protein